MVLVLLVSMVLLEKKFYEQATKMNFAMTETHSIFVFSQKKKKTNKKKIKIKNKRIKSEKKPVGIQNNCKIQRTHRTQTQNPKSKPKNLQHKTTSSQMRGLSSTKTKSEKLRDEEV